MRCQVMVEEPREEHKIVLKGTLWSLAGSMLAKLVSFIYLVIVARMLSADDVGTFYLALSIASGIAIISDLGFSSAFARYVPYFFGKKEEEKAYLLLSWGYLLSGVLSAIFAVALYLSSSWLAIVLKNPGLERVLFFFALYLVVNALFSLNNLFLQGRKRIKESNILINIQNTLKLLFTLALFFLYEKSIASMAIAFLVSFVVGLVLSFWLIKKDIAKLTFVYSLEELRKHFKLLKEVIFFGLTLSIVIALYTLIGSTDKILLSYFLPEGEGAAAIGIYTVAITMASLITLLPSAMGPIFFPLISEFLGKNKKEEMIKISKTAVRWVLFLLTPLTLIFIAFPDNILHAFYGSTYVAGAAVLAILSVATFMRFLAYIHGYLLAAVRLVNIEFNIALLTAIVNIALNILLIPKYGIEGAAVASAISLFVCTALLFYYTKKIFGFIFPEGFCKPFAAGILALMFIFLVKGYIVQLTNSVSDLALAQGELENLIVNKLIKLAILGVLFVFACIVYAATLMLMKAFDKEDIAIISAGLRKAKVPNDLVLFAERVIGNE